MRRVSTAVLPEPAPARISSGPSPCWTASRWGSLRPSRRVSGAAVALTSETIEMRAARLRCRALGLCDDVRAGCAAIAESARWVEIHLDAADEIQPGPPPVLDPDRHYLDGTRAEVCTELLARGMPFFDDRGFYKRAQIVASNLALAGVADFWDLDLLTIFADNLVPHVLRVDGVLTYDPDLGGRIDREELLPPGEEEREIRACALHACETIAAGLQVPPRVLDIWLWNRGQEPRYKALPRHRTRTVFY